MIKCPDCKATMKKVMVKVEGAKKKVKSYQCSKCDHFEFEKSSAKKVMKELESPLKIRQKIVKLSSGRLGMYFSKDIIRSLGLKSGEEISISVPSKKRIIVELE